ncbi:MAG: hypothetical protein LPK45_04030, partial [Bacteroidota bacterium]|nr:hypothetical protein [Bacteroidota bacterium]MDX5468982.1 hypothetical protein [Bacteroidota bacterium]
MIGRIDTAIGVKYLNILNTRIKLQPGHVPSKCIHISDKNPAGTSIAPTSIGGAHNQIVIRRLFSDSTFSGVMKFSNASVMNRAWDDDNLWVDSSQFIALGGSNSASTSLGFHANEHLKTLSITNNYFEGSNASSVEITAISVGSLVNANVTIKNNEIVNLNGRSSIIGIYCASGDRLYGATTNTLIQDNIVRKCSVNFNATIMGIRCQGNPSLLRVLDNSLDSVFGLSNWNAIYVTGLPDTIRVQRNTIRDFHFKSAGQIVRINQQSVHSVYIEDNVIDRCSAWGQLHGIWTNNASSQFWNIEGNVLKNLSVTSTNWVYAIYAQGWGTVHYQRNHIHDISGYQVFGIYAYRLTTTNYIYNNLIHSLNANYGAVGICLGQPAPYGIYHNTVYLDVKNPSSSTFNSSCLRIDFSQKSNPVDLQNNILINRSAAGSGSGYSVVLNIKDSPQDCFAPTTGNNNYYTGGTNIKNSIFIQSTSNAKMTFQDYLSFAVPRDQSSFSELSPFLDTINQPYHLNLDTSVATQVESGGNKISSPIQVDTDFDGNARPNAQVDVGAFEGSYLGTDRRSPSISFSELSSGLVTTTR